ncbi:MAG: alanine racemase [Bacteroidia bacterium]|nr:alanine racemase [Bacteroidia bacterium]
MIRKPTLVLNEDRCRKNITAMAAKAKRSGLQLRPHFKTHQSLEIGRWFKEEGIEKITVSSLEMARYFSEEWDDITVAFPVNVLEYATINELADKINLNLLVESLDSLTHLNRLLTGDINLYIKINIGNNRTGIDPKDHSLITRIVEEIVSSKHLIFAGFLGHAGQTYSCRSKIEIVETHAKAIGIMTSLRDVFKKDFPNLKISYGDTPSSSVCDDFAGIDELRPGNFVFYDLMQEQIGACNSEQIAVALACPVVAIHSARNEIIVYGGGIHLSKDSMHDREGRIFGRLIETNDQAWGEIIPKCFVKTLSQEHGIISVSDSLLKRIKIGDLIYILPVHSCMTANLMKEYLTTTGRKIEMFNPLSA